MEMEADEPGGDAGVFGEGILDGLPHESLGVGTGGAIEPHLQLRQARRRQQQPQGGHERHRAGQTAAHPHPEGQSLLNLTTRLIMRRHMFTRLVAVEFIERRRSWPCLMMCLQAWSGCWLIT